MLVPSKMRYWNISKFTRKYPEAATKGVQYKKVVLEISQNSQENTCATVSFLSLRPATLLKKRL